MFRNFILTIKQLEEQIFLTISIIILYCMFYVNDTQSEAHVGLKLQLLNFKIIISPNISIFLPADILKQKDRRIDNTSLVLQQMISNVYKHMAFS